VAWPVSAESSLLAGCPRNESDIEGGDNKMTIEQSPQREGPLDIIFENREHRTVASYKRELVRHRRALSSTRSGSTASRNFLPRACPSFVLVSGGGKRNLASGSERQRYRRIDRRYHWRGPVRAIGSCRDCGWHSRHGRPRSLYGRRPGSEPAATSHTKRDTGADFSHSSKGCLKEGPPGND
jgi:hypothetical protein